MESLPHWDRAGETAERSVRTTRARRRTPRRRAGKPNRAECSVRSAARRYSRGQRLERRFAHIEIGKHALDVFVFVEQFEEVERFRQRRAVQRCLLPRAHAQERTRYLQSGAFKCDSRRSQMRGIRIDFCGLAVFKVDHPVDQGRLREIVFGSSLRFDFEYSDRLEHPADAARLAESSAVLEKEKTQ